MRKKYKIEVDCANCAAKIEDAIKKISGVNEVSISFMTQKITIDANENDFENVISEAQRVCRKIDSDSRIIA